MRVRRRKAGAKEGAKWLTTFNDLMTLLMVFFVLLFSMSSVDLRKTGGMIESLQSALGMLSAGDKVGVQVMDRKLTHEQLEQLAKLTRKVEGAAESDSRQTAGQEAGGGGDPGDGVAGRLDAEPDIRTRCDRHSITITLEDSVLFDLGAAAINPAGRPVLDKISRTIRDTGHPIRVEGHTDNLPIRSSRYPSNWELSAARAVHVVKYFIARGGIAPERLTAVGYGASRPQASNATPQGRRHNRRVEIVLIKAKGQNNG